MDKWTLEDGEKRNKENPDTFLIPPKEERENLVLPRYVKLMFRIRVYADGYDSYITNPFHKNEVFVERMWVQATAKKDGIYLGILENEPACSNDIKVGTKVSFEPRHIINILDRL